MSDLNEQLPEASVYVDSEGVARDSKTDRRYEGDYLFTPEDILAARRAPAAAPAPVAASDKLPPLPEPTIEGSVVHPVHKICYRAPVHYTAEQMCDYARAALAGAPAAAAAPIVQPDDRLTDVLRDMLAIQEACGLHTDEYAPGSVIEYIKELESDAPPIVQPVRRKFFDLPLGTRFRYIGGKDEWIVMERHGCGLVAGYQPYDGWVAGQSICSFADTEDECRTAEVEIVATPSAPAAPSEQDVRKLAEGTAADLRQTLVEGEKRRGLDWIEYDASKLVDGIEAIIGDLDRAAIASSAGEVKRHAD